MESVLLLRILLAVLLVTITSSVSAMATTMQDKGGTRTSGGGGGGTSFNESWRTLLDVHREALSSSSSSSMGDQLQSNGKSPDRGAKGNVREITAVEILENGFVKDYVIRGGLSAKPSKDQWETFAAKPTRDNVLIYEYSYSSPTPGDNDGVVESIRKRSSGSGLEWANDDDKTVPHNTEMAQKPSTVAAAVGLSDAAADANNNNAKWTAECGTSTSKRHDGVTSNRTSSSSAAAAGEAAGGEEVKGAGAAILSQQQVQKFQNSSSSTSQNDSPLAALAMTANKDVDGDSAPKNIVVRNVDMNRSERANNMTARFDRLTSATAAPAADPAPLPRPGDTLIGSSGQSVTVTSRVSEGSGKLPKDEEEMRDEQTKPNDGKDYISTAHRKSTELGGGVGTPSRNKSSTSYNSIRTWNHISDRKPYLGKHHHSNDKYGPHFEDIKTVGNVTNMTVQMGQSVYLNCRISLLQDKTVSWMRRLVGENELQLLTVGNNTYSGDARYAVHYQYPNNWRLKITKTQVTDEGTYECQLSTHPPRVIQYNLQIYAPQVMITDEAGQALHDKYYEVDSTIQLSCIVRDVKMTSSVVYWNHSDQILNYDITRGGISVKTDLMENGANSTILVARVNKSDSGNYSCSISAEKYYTVTVHVLNGESYAELHHGNRATFRTYWLQSVWCVAILVLHMVNSKCGRSFNR